MAPPLATEAYTPAFTALCCAAVRRIPESLGRSPCGNVIMTQRGAGFSDGQADVAADRDGAADPVVFREAGIVVLRRHDDVGAEAPDFEAAVWVQHPQAVDRRGGQQVHNGDVEERPGRHLEIGHAVPVVQAGDVRPVLLGRAPEGI
jgi:hypothetical protein